MRARGLVVAGAVAFALMTHAGALAQSSQVPADAFRPLGANAEDVRDGRELAAAACAKCHGEDGVSPASGVPHLAGQRPSYVYLKLRGFQLGESAGGAHDTRLIGALGLDALASIAAFYASLDPAPPVEGAAPPFVDPVAAGKAASAPCAKCHGDNGVSRKAGVPSLIGLQPKYLIESMQAYKDGDRAIDPSNADMKTALDALDDDGLKAIALSYALETDTNLRAPPPPARAGRRPARMRCAHASSATARTAWVRGRSTRISPDRTRPTC